jgi:hypothetical protein
MFSARGNGCGRCVRRLVNKGIWKKANIRQLKTEVEYNEKPRGRVFPIKLVGCDNGYYVNLRRELLKMIMKKSKTKMLEWLSAYFHIKGGNMQRITTVSCQSAQEFADFMAKEFIERNTKIISIAPTGGLISQTDGKVEFHEYIVIWEKR